MVSYTNHHCWITNTYTNPFNKPLPTDDRVKQETEIEFYPWVSFILIALGAFIQVKQLWYRYM